MEERVPVEDWFVRSVVTGAVHVRRYRTPYAVGLAFAIAIAAVSPGGQVVPERGRTSTAQGAVAAGAVPGAVDPQVAFAEAVDAGLGAPSGDAVSAEAGVAPAELADGSFDSDADPVPPPTNPALAVGGPTAGKVCDTFGLAMLVTTLAAPAAPVPIPMSTLYGAVTPVYLACADIPRPSTRMACEADASVPAVPGAPVPVNPAAAAMVVEQMGAVEAATGANTGVSAALASSLGCRATT